MESSVKRTQRDYTLAFKLAVVEQVEKGELTYKQAQQRYGIQGRSTVLVWLRSLCATESPEMPEPMMATFMAGPLWPTQRLNNHQLKLVGFD